MAAAFSIIQGIARRNISGLQSRTKFHALAHSLITPPYEFYTPARPIAAPRGPWLLCVPMGMLGQPSQDLPPMPEDLIPALRPILVSALSQSPQMVAHNISIAQAEAPAFRRPRSFPSLGPTSSTAAIRRPPAMPRLSRGRAWVCFTVFPPPSRYTTGVPSRHGGDRQDRGENRKSRVCRGLPATGGLPQGAVSCVGCEEDRAAQRRLCASAG